MSENGVHSKYIGKEYRGASFPDYQEPVAICGIGCKFSGGATDASSLWEMLLEERSGHCRVPPSRFNVDSFYSSAKDRPGSFHMNSGYFLQEDPRDFEPSFFGIRDTEAMTMDPQQRKLLEVVYMAFESAGVTLEDVAGSQTGCFVGTFKPWDYATMITHDPEYPPPNSFTGTSMTLMSNRLSYIFDMKGPSLSLDTGCSSSLYALHLACTALASRECSAAVVAGVSLMMSAEAFIGAARAGFLSPDGVCHTFDSAANGFGRGEGTAAVYLKRFSDAVRDGDPIRAIIKGTAINANGRTAGITHPCILGQEEAIRRAYERAGLDPSETSYFECHGTGTPVGDPIEVSAIKNVFAQGRRKDMPLLIGSVKTNLGHTEPTAGLAGLIKIVLAMERDVIPATLGFRNPNPSIDFAGAKVKVVDRAQPWPSDTTVRRASLNSFGYGGANSHAIVEASTPTYVFSGRKNTQTSHMAGHLRLLTFSAHRAENLHENITNIRRVADKYNVEDLAHTLNLKRSHFFHRAYAIPGSGDVSNALDPSEVVSGQIVGAIPSVVFAFTGQGAQYKGMAMDLIKTFPVFAKTIDELDDVLSTLGSSAPDWTIKQHLQGTGDFKSASISQPICTAIQVGLVNLLESWNVRPRATIGHSSGEIAAAFASGFITAREAIITAYFRGLLSSGLASQQKIPAAMAAVGLGVDDLRPLIHEAAEGDVLTIACINSSASTTVSGSEAAIDRLYAILLSKRVFMRKLSTGGCAYHSCFMSAIGDAYELALDQNWQTGRNGYRSSRTTVPMISSVTGKWVGDSRMVGPRYWRQNLESPVLFAPALSTLLKSKNVAVDVVMELGPHSALSAPIKQTVAEIRGSGDTLLYTPSLVRGKNPQRCMMTLAGSLFVSGCAINLKQVNRQMCDEEEPKTIVDLPHYQWNYAERYWYESRLSTEFRFRAAPRHDLLGSRLPGSTDSEWSFRNILHVRDLPWLADHQIGTTIVLPAAGMICMAIEAATQCIEERKTLEAHEVAGYTLRNVFVNSAIQLSHDGGVETILNIRRLAFTGAQHANMTFEFSIRSTPLKDGHGVSQEVDGVSSTRWSHNALGQITVETRKRKRNILFDPAAEQWTDMSEHEFQRICIQSGLNYTGSFTGISSIRRSLLAKRATTSIPMWPTHNVTASESRYAIHPAVMDLCFQTIIPAISASQECQAFLPVSVRELSVPTNPLLFQHSRGFTQAEAELVGRRTCIAKIQLRGENGELLLDARDFSCLAIDSSNPQEKKAYSAPYALENWKIDIENLSREQAERVFPVSCDSDAAAHTELVATFSLLCMINVIEDYPELPPTKVQDAEKTRHLEYYHRYLSAQACGSGPSKVPAGLLKNARSMSRFQREAEIARIARENPSTPYITAIHCIYRNMGTILSGEVTSLELLTDGSTLSDIYDGRKTPSLQGAFIQLRNIVRLMGHQNPGMKILEIGAGTGSATRVILEGLCGTGSAEAAYYGSYTFTDISTGFFPDAKEAFQAYGNVEYRALDIEADVSAQSFSTGTYDLIVASNVIHATDMQKSLEGVKALLKPSGKFLVMETTNEPLGVGMLFGTLPGWWAGVSRNNELSPLLSRGQWEELLRSRNFDLRIALDDYELPYSISTVMVATPAIRPVSHVAASEASENSVTLIYYHQPHQIVSSLKMLLQEYGHKTRTASLEEYGEMSDQSAVICLADLEKPFLLDMKENEMKSMVSWVHTARSVLWITSCCIMDGTIPEHAPTWGLARALRAELPSPQTVMDLGPIESPNEAASSIASLFNSLGQGICVEHELALQGGVLYTNRIVPAVDANMWSLQRRNKEKFMRKISDSPSLRLDIQDVGMFDTLYFREDHRHQQPLLPNEVEVKMMAFGLNMKEVLSLSGKIDQMISTEGSGIVSRVGLSVTSLKPGDKVCGLFFSDFGTYGYSSPKILGIFPDGYSFEEMATVPTVYTTVFEAFMKIGRLCPGERLLIHAAAGGVGVAAIELARALQAEVYCTVSSQEKREFLVNSLGISPDHIFNSRSTSFYDDILDATSGEGIDVALNATTHEMLHETVRLLRTGGRHIEIGKVDISGNGKLDMREFRKAISFSHIDLTVLPEDRVSELLTQSLEAISSRKVRLLRPITIFGLCDIERACRYFMEGHHMGKVVLSCDDKRNEGEIKFLPSLKLRLEPDATYLLVGCLGGLGRALVSWMASRGARRFLMLSRSGMDNPEAARMIRELSVTHQAVIKVVRGDVAHKPDIERAIQEAETPIRGVIQAAMVLEDSIFFRMSAGAFNKVMGPKVHGTKNLNEVFYDEPLDFFVCTSSISAVLGMPSQSNYSAANMYLDAVAKNRTSRGLHGATVAVSIVKDIGIISENPELQEKVNAHGLYRINSDEFLEAMEYAMMPQEASKPEKSLLITGLDAKRLSDHNPGNAGAVFDNEGSWGNEPRFSALRAAVSKAGEGYKANGIQDSNTSVLAEIVDAITTQGEEEALEILLKAFRDRLSKVLMISVERIDSGKKVSEYGMDSMAGAEVRRWFSKVLEVEFPFLILLSPVLTIEDLARRALVLVAENNGLGSGKAGSGAVSGE